jgi:hypothetical protein
MRAGLAAVAPRRAAGRGPLGPGSPDPPPGSGPATAATPNPGPAGPGPRRTRPADPTGRDGRQPAVGRANELLPRFDPRNALALVRAIGLEL